MALHFVPRKPRAEQIKELEAEWKKNPRWKGVKRGYTGRRTSSSCAARFLTAARSPRTAPTSCGTLMTKEDRSSTRSAPSPAARRCSR